MNLSPANQDPWFLANLHAEGRNRFQDISIPSLPSCETQKRFTGLSGHDNLLQGFRFWQLARSAMEPSSETAVLDFGCGWGRIGRFWLRDLQPEQIHLTDCLTDAINLLKETGNPCQISQCKTLPPLSWEGKQFDILTAYSVFSHLSEDYYLAWMREFYGRLKPGGKLLITSRDESFLEEVRSWQESGRERPFNVSSMPAWNKVKELYESGEFQFYPTSGGGGELGAEFYGQAFVPEAYVKATGKAIGFSSVTRIEPPSEIDQAVFILTK